jgi:hypothetical protein
MRADNCAGPAEALGLTVPISLLGDPRGITFSFDFEVRDCSDGPEHC